MLLMPRIAAGIMPIASVNNRRVHCYNVPARFINDSDVSRIVLRKLVRDVDRCFSLRPAEVHLRQAVMKWFVKDIRLPAIFDT